MTKFNFDDPIVTKFNFDDPIAEGRKLIEEAQDYPKLSNLQFENFRYAHPEQVLNHINILCDEEADANRQYNHNNISIIINRRKAQVIKESIPEKEMVAHNEPTSPSNDANNDFGYAL